MAHRKTKSSTRKFNRTKSLLAVAVAAVVGGAGLRSAHGANATWNTAGTSVNWSLTGNWTGNQPTGNSLIFGADNSVGTAAGDVLNDDLAAATSITGITFNAGDPAYTINGNSITLVGSITNSGTTLETINDANHYRRQHRHNDDRRR